MHYFSLHYFIFPFFSQQFMKYKNLNTFFIIFTDDLQNKNCFLNYTVFFILINKGNLQDYFGHTRQENLDYNFFVYLMFFYEKFFYIIFFIIYFFITHTYGIQ